MWRCNVRGGSIVEEVLRSTPVREAALASGADDAFEEFVRGRSAHLFRLALALTGWNEASAQDLLQIALERAYRHRRMLYRDGGFAEPYVRRILVNAAIDWRRVTKRRSEQPLDSGWAGPVVRDPAEQVDDRDVLLRALAALAPRQRAVLVMRYWEDLSDAQIAAAMNCTEGTVRSQALRGLSRLRQLTGAGPASGGDYSTLGQGHG